ncbi:hypothetical protein BO99DRAFT_261400 [Aspergillus violaceofuscus CBS 115571]|uniref:Uncharacterized protein n=1 Tax=Aspergillus violaceofuscus (strain CBS 115571) TaxID=1450538 RepID=A0A2V5GVF6_ASPV1|nr:hypothetical protein BO99DRAFT_261400 [Aspergillus violaceofuscus CBS 115571]
MRDLITLVRLSPVCTAQKAPSRFMYSGGVRWGWREDINNGLLYPILASSFLSSGSFAQSPSPSRSTGNGRTSFADLRRSFCLLMHVAPNRVNPKTRRPARQSLRV